MRAFYHIEKDGAGNEYRDILIIKDNILYVCWFTAEELVPFEIQKGIINLLKDYSYLITPEGSVLRAVQLIYNYYHSLPTEFPIINRYLEDIPLEKLLTHPILEIRDLVKEELLV